MDSALGGTGRQRLGAELRRMRDLAGVAGRDLAGQIGMSQSKVSRIEAGSVLPSLPEVAAWANALGVVDDVREKLVSLTKAAYTEVHPWRAVLQSRGHLQDHVHERESTARRIRTFQHSVIPGLLQTAEYARRVFSMFHVPYADEDLAAAVAARLHRQLSIFEQDRQFEFLITEAALRWRPGPPKLLLAQLDRVSSISTLENVSVGLIPMSEQATTLNSHGFVIHDDHDDHGFVTIEMIHADVTVNNPADIEVYEKRWSLLGKTAAFDDDARALLAILSTELHTVAK